MELVIRILYISQKALKGLNKLRAEIVNMNGSMNPDCCQIFYKDFSHYFIDYLIN